MLAWDVAPCGALRTENTGPKNYAECCQPQDSLPEGFVS